MVISFTPDGNIHNPIMIAVYLSKTKKNMLMIKQSNNSERPHPVWQLTLEKGGSTPYCTTINKNAPYCPSIRKKYPKMQLPYIACEENIEKRMKKTDTP
jgi:hypothetical protein